MGKILNALKAANGDIPELVLQCLDEVREAPAARAPDVRPFHGRRGAAASVVEPIFEMPPVVQLPQRVDHGDRPQPPQEFWPDAHEMQGVPGLADGQAKPGIRQVSFRLSDSSPLLSPKREDRRAAEEYRIVRTRIFHQLSGSSITVVASPGMGDGKTVTAVNLAAALAHKSEDKVILVDADLRLSKVHERLGIPRAPGLAEVLSGVCALEDAMLRVEQLPNFYVLPAGLAEGNPSELLDSSNWRGLLARLREEFRRTIVDSPPVEAVADYDLIAAHCDGVVLVVRPDHTSRSLLTGALAKVKGKLTGVLINDVEDWFLWKRETPSDRYYQNSSRNKEGPKAAKP
ncbi:MAG: CpsD/CapB family tyrosine-protein kinase [Bryobacteraceae bacterium]|jgi:capsular exopolysaccharide synthesis family protein